LTRPPNGVRSGRHRVRQGDQRTE